MTALWTGLAIVAVICFLWWINTIDFTPELEDLEKEVNLEQNSADTDNSPVHKKST